MEKIKVFVVDDSVITKTMFSNAIKETEDIEIVGEVSSGPGCIIMFEEINPDVVMLKITIGGGMSVESIVKELRKIKPTVKVIICTDISYKCDIEELLVIEPDDFIVKPYQKENVLRIIRTLAKEDK